MPSVLVSTEIVIGALMAIAVVVLATTGGGYLVGFGGLSAGLTLTMIHLATIPVDNTSVNPARSTGPALVVGGLALQQLWIFWVAPIVGAVVGGGLYRWLLPEASERPDIEGQ